MSRWKLTIAYDGRAFGGWQTQPEGQHVQTVIKAALAGILKLPEVRLHGAGRTDAGVHALAQTAHFDAPDDISLTEKTWVKALNRNLPPAIRVYSCEPVAPDFHARFDATGKVYSYRICTAPIMPPLEVGLAWHLPRKICRATLEEAARAVCGRHDFSSFCANRGDEEEQPEDRAVRSVWSVRIEEAGPFLALTFHGEGFLYKMVRLLTGSILRCAIGKENVEWLVGMLENPGVKKSHHLAPADGLYLVRVEYQSPK